MFITLNIIARPAITTKTKKTTASTVRIEFKFIFYKCDT